MKKTGKDPLGFKFALRGIFETIRTERNARVHLVCAAVVLLAGWFFRISRNEWLVLVLTISAVITAEIVNTAVELTVDLYTPRYHPLAEKAKNAAAGAVLVSAIGAVAVGLIIFGPKLWGLLF